MWSLLSCRRTSAVSLFVRDAGDYTSGLRILQCSFLVSGYRRFSSVEAVERCDELKRIGGKHSFTVSYLRKSCGLTLESAKSISGCIRFDSPEKPDSVLELLKDHGFTGHQITKVVKSYPQILVGSVDAVLLPKLEFIGSIGFLGAERTKLITSCPRMLAGSLQNTLIPSYNALKSVLSGDEIVQCLMRSSRLLILDVQKHLASKVSILSSHGVPQGHIKTLLKFAPRVISYPADKFDETVKRVVALGFDPTQLKLIYAVSVVCQLKESTWQNKIKVYKSLGWSEDDIFLAFKSAPLSMSLSEKKIRSTMDFYVNKLGLPPSLVAKTPTMIGFSLEKRIKPRCLVMAILLSEGVLKKESISYPYVLAIADKQFAERFVNKYCKDIPRLLTVFQGKSSFRASSSSSMSA